MATSPSAQNTDFSRDVIGRYTCNGLDEALLSTQKTNRPDGIDRPDARPFDVIIIGGGSFGGVLAQGLFAADKTQAHRILVLEAGRFALPEHIQNLPLPGLGVPAATSIAELRQQGADGKPRQEVWGLAWHSDHRFPGLAYCLGGRSLYFGGWSPRLLDSEMPADRWPAAVRDDLTNSYFGEASDQIGTSATNDFINGPLHGALRQRLHDGVVAGQMTEAIPLAQLPLHLPDVPPGQEDLMKFEAPLAVQSNAPRSGFYPFNKFSSMPLLMKASRAAQMTSGGDDIRKRLMIVPDCHVKRLITSDGTGKRVAAVETNLGTIPAPENGAVVIALSTIESARLARTSFPNLPNTDRIGHNLIAHLRSNVTIRIPRAALPAGLPAELQASALFVKGRHDHGDGKGGHFHLQITAAGLDKPGPDSEAELFKKVPDIDGFDRFLHVTDNHVVMTLRGIGEMEPDNPDSGVRLDPELDEYNMPRAIVALPHLRQPPAAGESPQSTRDRALWNAMDEAADQVALIFANGQAYEVLTPGDVFKPVPANQLASTVHPFDARRDGLGTTHHEAGTLAMGDDATKSVTNSDGRFHHVENCYAAGPAAFPTVGSPNPMLTGVALSRRLADHLSARSAHVTQPEPGFTLLFNGHDLGPWRMSTITDQAPDRSDPGGFEIIDGALQVLPGNDLGLLWHTAPTPPDFVLKLQWRALRPDDNSGVFLRFPDPRSKGYNNTAYVGVDFGFEVQIDEMGGLDKHLTGAIYDRDDQVFTRRPVRPVGQWNDFEIRVQGQTYTVHLNGQQTTTFTFPGDPSRPDRGLSGGFLGLQTHFGSRVAFRDIQIKAL